MTRISPLREGATISSVSSVEDMSFPVSDPTHTVFPLFVTATVRIPPFYVSATPSWAIKHCKEALRDLKVWADGVWWVVPYELGRYQRDDGDFETWWVACIGPRTRKQPCLEHLATTMAP